MKITHVKHIFNFYGFNKLIFLTGWKELTLQS